MILGHAASCCGVTLLAAPLELVNAADIDIFSSEPVVSRPKLDLRMGEDEAIASPLPRNSIHIEDSDIGCSSSSTSRLWDGVTIDKTVSKLFKYNSEDG
jgi:hypothetical protein